MKAEDMDKLVSQLENKLKRSFVEMVRSIKDDNSLAELTAKIARGDLSNLVSGIEAAVERFATDITAGYVGAGQKAARWLDTKTDKPIRFNINDEHALQWMEETQAELIRSLVADQQALAIRVVGDGRARGLTDQQIAEEVRGAIGLNAEQYKHVETYRSALESGNYRNAMRRELADARSNRALQAADESGRFLAPERIDAMVERYVDNWLAYRAENVGLVEANGATHAGVDELITQAMEAGDVELDDIERVWVSRADKRVRFTHRRLHGQRRKLDEPFISGGQEIMFPGDPNAPSSETCGCRCVLRFVFKGSRKSTFRVLAA